MKLYLASDHAGFHLKHELAGFLADKNWKVIDCGPKTYEHDDDYPDYVSIAAKHISENPGDKAIIIGWSGQGEAMVANRFPGVRAAVFYGGSKHILTLARQHNDANILSLGAHFLTSDEAKTAVELWLDTKFSGEERHERRIRKIDNF